MHIRVNLALNTKNQISREACFLFCGYFPPHTITLGSSFTPFPIVSCSVIFGFTTPQVELNVRFQTDTHVNYPLAIVLYVWAQSVMSLVNTLMNHARGLSPDTHLILDARHQPLITLLILLPRYLPSHVTMQFDITNTIRASHQFLVA